MKKGYKFFKKGLTLHTIDRVMMPTFEIGQINVSIAEELHHENLEQVYFETIEDAVAIYLPRLDFVELVEIEVRGDTKHSWDAEVRGEHSKTYPIHVTNKFVIKRRVSEEEIAKAVIDLNLPYLAFRYKTKFENVPPAVEELLAGSRWEGSAERLAKK